MPADYTHSPTPEDIMEYLDGEGTAASRDAIAAHLGSCAACQAIAAEQRGISEHARAWTVAPAPASLRAPVPPRARILFPRGRPWRLSRAVAVALTAAAAVLVMISFNARELRTPGSAFSPRTRAAMPQAEESRTAGQPRTALDALASPVTSPAQESVQVAKNSAPRIPSIIRTATLRIVAKDFDPVRAAVEGIVSQAGGFIDQMTVTGDNTSARELRGTVRVPGEKMAAALARLRQIGQVVEDTQGSEDVTDQIVDLDARLASSRATEQRLTEILRNRTGKLSDVLEVEREITRVRLDIERLDAEKTNMGRRVTYATISLSIAEERKAGLVGPLSLATRIRIAAADGLESALDSATATVLFVLRAGPSLLLWGLTAGLVWMFGRRFLKPSA
jgi:hypothetical protein